MKTKTAPVKGLPERILRITGPLGKEMRIAAVYYLYMESRQLIWIGLFVGSTIGGFIPDLWGAGLFSLSSIFLSAAGGLLGIYVGYRLSAY